ncbi:MAG: hypothetical protein J5494_04065 [Candidatus Methanomethylophilaceae archaeon]|nr:hypothetical protein [Candidatus Methanomethylophilaceae archaeon]
MTCDRYFDDLLSDYTDKSPFPLDPDCGGRPGIAESTLRLSELAARFSCPVSAAAAAVFAYAVSRFTFSRDVVFTASEEGRLFPVRTDCGGKSAEEFVSSVSVALRNASAAGASFSQEDFEHYDIGQDVVFGELRTGDRINLSFSSDGDSVRLYHSARI